MPKRVKKTEQVDPNQWAKQLVERTTMGDERPLDFKEQLSAYMRELGRKGGRKSGKTRRQWLSKDDRIRVASEAAKARWAKVRKKKGKG